MRSSFLRQASAIGLLLAVGFSVQSPHRANALELRVAQPLTTNYFEKSPTGITSTLQTSIALTQIIPITKTNYGLRWDNNQNASIILDQAFKSEKGCQDETRLVYSLATSSGFTQTVACQINKISVPLKSSRVLSGENIEQLAAPNKNLALLVQDVLTPTIKTVLGNFSPIAGVHYSQIWLASKTGLIRPLFYTGEQFSYEWAKDNRHILAWSSCFGAIGAYTIDVYSGKISTLGKDDQVCEDGTRFHISPDSKNILYGNGIVTNLTGTRQIHICEADEFARSYAWSSDGRYAYATCYKANSTDSLRRYDSRLAKTTTVIDRATLIFKSYELAIAPDNKRVAFAWGDGVMNPNSRGVWVINLLTSGAIQKK